MVDVVDRLKLGRAFAVVMIASASGSVSLAGSRDDVGPYHNFSQDHDEQAPVGAPPQDARSAKEAARRWITGRGVAEMRRPGRIHVRPRDSRPVEVAALPSKPTSIYEDRTLRRGDAVMTDKGLRIFDGSRSFPYLPSDFVDLDKSRAVPKSIRKSLNAYNQQTPQAVVVAVASAPAMTVHLRLPAGEPNEAAVPAPGANAPLRVLPVEMDRHAEFMPASNVSLLQFKR